MEKYAAVYIDDILNFSATTEDHLRQIQHVLNQLRRYKIKLKLMKCELFYERDTILRFYRKQGRH